MKRDPAFALLPEVPLALTREGRARLFIELLQDLRAGRMPSREAAALVSTAGIGWLEQGGDFFRDYLKTKCEPGCHLTEQQIYKSVKNM